MICRMIFVLACICALQAFGGAPDFRPPFDKRDYKGTVGVQVNPWFPLNKAPSHALGGPNMAYLKPKTADWWGEGMKLCREYGVTMMTPESGRDWKTVSGTSPVPGGISTNM